MKLITEKNLSKIIIYIFIIIMSSMIFMITYFYVKNTYENFEAEMKIFKAEYYEIKKATLKKEVDTVLDIFNYNITKDYTDNQEQKNEAIRLLNNIRFEKNKSNYFFVYEIKNMNGGDEFAKLLVNPNRLDIVGSLISTNYEDANGKKFREMFLRDIREKKESYTQYSYKKPGTKEIKQKLSYFKYYKTWNWVLAVGVYTDDIEKEISIKREHLESRIKKQVGQNVVLFIMFLSLAILISIVVSQKIDEVLKHMKIKLKLKHKSLKI